MIAASGIGCGKPDLHVERARDDRPDVFPGENVAVGDVERLVGAAVSACPAQAMARASSRASTASVTRWPTPG